MPLVSIVVPNFNHLPFLHDRLESIFHQRFLDYEVLLLDDASTDGSAAFMETYKDHPRVTACLFNQYNSGSTFLQWNRGISAARGRYVWIAESDDRAAPELLETLAAALEADPQRVLAYCQSRRIDHSGQVTGDWLSWTEDLAPGLFLNDFDMDGDDFVQRMLLQRNVIPNASAVLFRRDAFLACGGADPEVRCCGDWFVYLKLVMQGRVSFRASALNDFRQHEKSVIASHLTDRREVFLKKYDVQMRRYFDHYLENKAAHAPQVKRLNLFLLRKEAEREARLLIKHGKHDDAKYYIDLSMVGGSLSEQWRRKMRLAKARLRAWLSGKRAV